MNDKWNGLSIRGIEIDEIINIIGRINHEIFKQTGGEEGVLYRPLQFIINGGDFCSSCLVTLFSEIVWSSEDDERDFDEENDEYEPFEEFLRKEIRKVLNEIKTINI